MAEPSFRQKWEWARAHQKPAPDAPDLVVDNAGGAEEPVPPDWTEDALRSVPRPLPPVRSPADGRYSEPRVPPAPPHVFQGPIGAIESYPEDGKNAWRASNDAAIVAAVNRHNAERNLYPGDAEFMTPKLMKSWAMEESGSGADRAEFERDPFQVNKPRDWAPEKERIAGLREGQAMTPETSADAALRWLAHKARMHRDENNKVRRGPYWTPYESLRNYNANWNYEDRDQSDPSNRHDNRYADLILGRARE
jgi:hypothetical protein